MSRNEALEQVLKLMYDLDHCDPGDRFPLQHSLTRILTDLAQRHQVGMDEMRAALHEPYIEYRRSRRADERRRLARGVR